MSDGTKDIQFLNLDNLAVLQRQLALPNQTCFSGVEFFFETLLTMIAASVKMKQFLEDSIAIFYLM